MKQLEYVKTGSYNVLNVQEVDDLKPKDDELLISVKAAGLNFADILARKGQYPDGPSTPCMKYLVLLQKQVQRFQKIGLVKRLSG